MHFIMNNLTYRNYTDAENNILGKCIKSIYQKWPQTGAKLGVNKFQRTGMSVISGKLSHELITI